MRAKTIRCRASADVSPRRRSIRYAAATVGTKVTSSCLPIPTERLAVTSTRPHSTCSKRLTLEEGSGCAVMSAEEKTLSIGRMVDGWELITYVALIS